jgi:hypothetical protein
LLCAIAAAVIAGPVASAGAAVQSRADPSDAPAGAFGKADLRAIDWDVGDTSATLRVALDESTYADIGVHVLLDTDGDGLADADIAASRNADGVSVDVALRTLDRTLSTVDCQDLDGKSTSQIATVSTTIAGGIESFAFTFDPTAVPGHLAAFGWAAFAQAPADTAGGPWDVMPDAADPERVLNDPELGYISRYALGRDYHKVLRTRLARLADRIITTGEAVAARVRETGVPSERIVAITAGVDAARFHPGVSGKAGNLKGQIQPGPVDI